MDAAADIDAQLERQRRQRQRTSVATAAQTSLPGARSNHAASRAVELAAAAAAALMKGAAKEVVVPPCAGRMSHTSATDGAWASCGKGRVRVVRVRAAAALAPSDAGAALPHSFVRLDFITGRPGERWQYCCVPGLTRAVPHPDGDLACVVCYNMVAAAAASSDSDQAAEPQPHRVHAALRVRDATTAAQLVDVCNAVPAFPNAAVVDL